VIEDNRNRAYVVPRNAHMQEHKTIMLTHPFFTEMQDVAIDATIAPLIEGMWLREWMTFNSCEDNFGYVWLELDHTTAEELLTLVAQHASDESVARSAASPTPMADRRPMDLRAPAEDPEEWLIGVLSGDVNEVLKGDEIISVGPPAIMISISIRFPKHHLSQVTEIVRGRAACAEFE
jgi:hypothetical protein